MNRFLRFAIPMGLLLALVLLLGGGLRAPAAHADARHWVCVACGLPCDSKVFDRSGSCPDCGMALVEQGSAQATPAVDTRRKVAVLIFNGVEIIDSMGPYELFGAANYDVFTVGETKEPVTSAMGMTMVPRYTFADAPRPDVLVVPGGGVRGAQQNAALLKYVVDATAAAHHTMSVCNGSFILASAGLLDGLTATSTYGNVLRLHQQFPNVKVVGDQRFVDNGKIITTAGLSAGMDGALHVISKLDGEARAREVALGEEYNWQPAGGYVRPAMADRFIPSIDVEKEAGTATAWKVVSSTGDTKHWDITVRGSSTQSAEQLLGNLGQAIEKQARWSALPAGAAAAKGAGSRSRAWSFEDLDGRTWRGTLTVEPAAGAAGEYTARLVVARNS